MYYRIFGINDAAIAPAALLEHLHSLGFEVTGHFKGDEEGWFHADLIFDDADARFELDRYLASEEGIRHQLNTWAAWLETACPDQPQWLQHLVSTRQVFTLRRAEEDVDGEACTKLCKFLARETAGIYQLDGKGFFTEDGILIATEDEPSEPEA